MRNCATRCPEVIEQGAREGEVLEASVEVGERGNALSSSSPISIRSGKIVKVVAGLLDCPAVVGIGFLDLNDSIRKGRAFVVLDTQLPLERRHRALGCSSSARRCGRNADRLEKRAIRLVEAVGIDEVVGLRDVAAQPRYPLSEAARAVPRAWLSHRADDQASAAQRQISARSD